MMFRDADQLMFARCTRVGSDTLAAVMNFNLVVTFTNPYRCTRIDPWHRVPIAFPCHVRVASDLAQLFINVGIWQSADYGLKSEFLFRQSLIHTFMRCAVNTLVGHFPHPLSQPTVQVR